LKILDAAGKTLNEFRAASKEAGFHRQTWSLNRQAAGPPCRRALIASCWSWMARNTPGNHGGDDPHADPKAVIAVEAETRRDEEEREKEGWDEEED